MNRYRELIPLGIALLFGLIPLSMIAESAESAIRNAPAVTFNLEISESRAQELEHLVRHDCGSCHGMQLKGGLGPSLLPETFADKNIDYIKLTILHGRPGTAMPPWKSILSEVDAEWIAHYLMTPEQLANKDAQ